jgi:beta-lysine 5,6-aminomutase alpha subunit
MKTKLGLSEKKIARARELAASIAAPVQEYIAGNTTVAVERATLRALGADGVNSDGVPVPNLAVEAVCDRLKGGAARHYIGAMLRKGLSVDQLNAAIADGLDIGSIEQADPADVRKKAEKLWSAFEKRVVGNTAHRNTSLEKFKKNAKSPMLYLIVATGNIHEDVKQATAAAVEGADAIAVIRSTIQSLLDYVPYGATTEGFGGTYATQENFRIMREALDEVIEKEERYVRLVNYASGLCMPEIAVMGAMERLDMMLNDSMYGILFRDINMYRTFVDQHFSRMLNALADIIINTGEDNYLTTSDAYEKAYTVSASQFINERFARNAGLESRLIGLGHAFEIDPSIRNAVLYELAQAQMAREIFPECPLKYMPPTKFMTGDIFRGYIMDGMFNFVSAATGQSIHLLGMLSEAIQTPFMQDRYLAVENAKYVMNAIADFQDEIDFRKDGIIAGRAREVLDQTIAFLEEVSEIGLFDSIEQGMFAEIKRPKDGGKGLDGVVEKAEDYWNPVEERLGKG